MERKIFYKMSYGLYIVSSLLDGKLNGQIANTVFQVTSTPPQIALAINKSNLTHQYILKSNVFSVSILLKATPLKFISLFGFRSGREVDKFKDINYKFGVTGTPIVLDNTIGYLEAEVNTHVDTGTHTVFIGKVVAAEFVKDGEPMTYTYYHAIKGGKVPQSAPTYIKEESHPTGMTRYRCTICGYIYAPEKGDPDSGIKRGKLFEELPDDWVCPICGALKEQFKELEE